MTQYLLRAVWPARLHDCLPMLSAFLHRIALLCAVSSRAVRVKSTCLSRGALMLSPDLTRPRIQHALADERTNGRTAGTLAVGLISPSTSLPGCRKSSSALFVLLLDVFSASSGVGRCRAQQAVLPGEGGSLSSSMKSAAIKTHRVRESHT